MPFGYLEFSRAIGREPCPLMRAPPLAAAAGRPVPGLGSGPVLISGSGSGSLPGLVLFESGLTGMGYAKHTRSAIQIRTGPPTDPPRYPDPNRSSWTTNSCDCSNWTANSCNCWVEPLQRFRPNRCNLSLGSDPLAPPGAL